MSDSHSEAPIAARRTRLSIAALALCLIVTSGFDAHGSATCPEEQDTPQVPTDLALCEALDPIVRKPSALP